MSTKKHTPGPWAVYESMGAETVIGRIGVKAEVDIAHCNNCDTSEARANARLIAAAPDLLFALDQAVTSMQDSGYPNSHLAVRCARAAIARATGKEPA